MTNMNDSLYKWLIEGGNDWRSLDAILNVLDALVLILDREANVVVFNRACEVLTGYSFEEVKNRPFYEFFLVPDEHEAVMSVFQGLNAGMFPNRYENYWLTKSKDRRLIAWSNTALVKDSGEVAYIVGTGIDITEQRLAEAEVREREQHFRLVADYTYDCEYWQDANGKIVYMSPACQRISGYPETEFYKNPDLLTQIVHPEDRALFTTHHQEANHPDTPPMEIEFRIVTKTGDVRWIVHGCQTVFDDRGGFLGRRASNRDETARKNAQVTLVESQRNVERRNAILDAINVILQETLACETDQEVARICLREAEKLTGARFGFIGEINADGRFDTIALSNPGWTTCNLPESEAARLIRNMEIRGLWGVVLQTGKFLIANHPAQHPARVGIPIGHPPLNSFLGAPLTRDGRVVGMTAMADKDGGFEEEDAEALEAVSAAFLEALNRKRHEQQLMAERKQLLSIFDGINEIVYVADPDTYEILFMNQHTKEIFGEAVGRICHQVFQGKDRPCEFCTNEIIFGEKKGQAHVWEFYNENVARWFRCIDRAIRWPDGRMVRYELAMDITEAKLAEAKARRSAISRQLVGEMFRDLQALSDLREGDLFNAGRELAARIESNSIDEFIETFGALGLGTLTLENRQPELKRWTFQGSGLMESSVTTNKPTGNYTRGFLCGAVAKVSKAARVAAVETECQSMGDAFCRIVVQVLS